MDFNALEALIKAGGTLTGGGTVYNPAKDSWESRFDAKGNIYQARLDTPLHFGHTTERVGPMFATPEPTEYLGPIGQSYSGSATQANYQLPPSENLERLGQSQGSLDRVMELQRQAQYEADRQEGLRRYAQMNQQPAPSFNESLMAYLSSQGVDNQRAQYEADRQEGLRRFNNVYGGGFK
jgi:hypothetical protein